SIFRSVREHRLLSVALGIGIVFLTALGIPRLGGHVEAINSVAVLPFENLTTDPSLEYVPDGLAQDLINNLSRFPSLKVTPWNSVNRLRGQAITEKEVAGKLGVKALVTGRLVKEGERLVIALELVDTTDNHLLWGNRYERAREDLSSLVTQMNRELSEHLHLAMKPQSQAQAIRQATTNPEAYDLFLKGQYFREKRTDEDFRRSLDYFRSATQRDPSFAAALAGLSTAYSSLGGSLLHPSEIMPEARRYASKALEL